MAQLLTGEKWEVRGSSRSGFLSSRAPSSVKHLEVYLIKVLLQILSLLFFPPFFPSFPVPLIFILRLPPSSYSKDGAPLSQRHFICWVFQALLLLMLLLCSPPPRRSSAPLVCLTGVISTPTLLPQVHPCPPAGTLFFFFLWGGGRGNESEFSPPEGTDWLVSSHGSQ